jgi:vacuolar-type H+-ATPase subunit I/STV1
MHLKITLGKKMKKIDKHTLKSVRHSKSIIDSALSALQKIDTGVAGSDEAFEKVASFKNWLRELADSHGATIAQAELDYKNRPQALIDEAFKRIFQIPDEIQKRRHTNSSAIKDYEMQVEDLKHRGFSTGQIEKIVNDPVDEIARREAEIIELNSERERLEAFVDDAPRFDEELLVGTKLEELVQLGSVE